MTNIKKFIFNNMLFIKIFLVMISSIVLVSVFITFSSIQMSSNLFIETSSITNSKVLNQIKDRFQSYTHSISSTNIKVSNNGTIESILKEKQYSALERSNYYYNMVNQMEGIYNELEESNINMIIVSRENDIFNMNYFNWPVNSEKLLVNQITKESEQHPDEILYHYIDSPITYGVPMIVATKALTGENNEDIYGYLYLSIHEEDIKNYYEGFTSEGNDVFLMSADGEIMSSSKEGILGEQHPELLNQVTDQSDVNDDYQTVEVFNDNYILLSEYLPYLDMYVVNLINEDMLRSNLVNTKEIIFISIVIVLGAVLISFFILKRMTKSISRLVYQISDMRRYQFNKPLKETGGYESRKIASAFNYMLDELQDYVSLLLKTQEKQQQTELQVLQHQINPHFIYNTLASIKFLIKQGKSEQALTTIDSFISLLQNNLSDMKELITVEQELDILKSYVHITQARYGDQIRVNYLVSPDCLSLQLPKLIIQPFIENAFFHGFSNQKKGIIQVLIAKKNNQLICEIVDNGDGIPSSKMNTIGETKKLYSGIGIKNVHNRIQLQYGKTYGVEIDSEQYKGTRIKISLPVIE